ncbi:MAG TPA: trypsin-like peptidase domain-containing protein [Arthrobacter sp.]|nr:trypsin-like peptidase domain-containing protein [Arthrobacter sp.]
MTHLDRHHPRRSNPGRVLLAAALIMALAGCTGGSSSGPSATDGTTQAQGGGGGASGGAQPGGAQPPGGIPDIVQRVQPSVVTIFTKGGLGSGVVYSKDGLVLTNEHVVGNSTKVEVAFADGQRSSGQVLATDAVSDLALVRTGRKGLPAVTFAPSLPRIGEVAVVIGSPLGFENTATAGIISGLHRSIPGSSSSSLALVDLIQTDAAISPGNSGGAVVNAQGQLVGISEAYIPPQAGAVSLGFAIPAATAKEVAGELLKNGVAKHAFMGLAPATITPEIAQQLGMQHAGGVVALNVTNGGPADKAGIQPGDVLVSVDGEALETSEDLLAVLRKHDPGDVVTVETRRGSDTSTVKVTLSDRPTG